MNDQSDELNDWTKSKIKQEAYRKLKASVKEHAQQAASERASRLIAKLKLELDGADSFECKPRNLKEMHAFAYGIINRELSRLDLKSVTCGLSDDEIQSLTRLIGTINITERTKKAVNEEPDETKQREGESDDDYRARLENAIKR